MYLLLINPRNPLASLTNKSNYWNRYRVWKPLGLLVLAGLTPPDWDISVVDENVEPRDYSQMPRPDLVGVTAFTSQAPRAYELAEMFRAWGVPVVMGGIHATMRREEAAKRVDAVVTGEAESVWGQVIEDAANGVLSPSYAGGHEAMENTPPARHDLLSSGYQFGAIQTTRGCPLNCSFCSVSAFNGRTYRRRAIEDVVAEFKLINEKHVLVVDDNLIGTRRDHIARAKDLFRAMVEADLGKKWICQATINMADDEELLRLGSPGRLRRRFHRLRIDHQRGPGRGPQEVQHTERPRLQSFRRQDPASRYRRRRVIHHGPRRRSARHRPPDRCHGKSLRR